MPKPPSPKRDGIVYSTRHGQMCPDCGRPSAACVCRRSSPSRTQKPGPPSDGIVRLWRETKGRKGKGVTRITGLPLGDADLSDLAKTLKQKCGSGGTIRDGVIEIQGDHRDALLPELEKRGFRVKKAGG